MKIGVVVGAPSAPQRQRTVARSFENAWKPAPVIVTWTPPLAEPRAGSTDANDGGS